ncbi:MAG: helicase C-terminal domain-containing protein [Nitrospiraceae bacterium]
MDLLPSPSAIGAPPKFHTWRKYQQEAVVRVMESDKRFLALAMPTGFGKSLVYVMQALIMGARVCILTSTKGLQDQLAADFGPIGLLDIRGQNSYPCRALEEGKFPWWKAWPTCDNGPCHAGFMCEYRDEGCDYFDAQRLAMKAKMVVTNYHYWMAINAYSKGLGEFDLLVLDEAHDAPEVLAGFMETEIARSETPKLLGNGLLAAGATMEDWGDWARYNRDACQEKLDQIVERLGGMVNERAPINPKVSREAMDLRKLLSKLNTLAEANPEWWGNEPYEKHTKKGRELGHRFAPTWPAPYAHPYLFLQVPKIVLTSATLRPKTCEMLNISSEDLEFREYPSIFPVERRPVTYIKTVRVGYRTSDDQMLTWVRRIDQILRARPDSKGIIHTVSYKRAQLLLDNTQHRDRLLSHDPRTTRTVVQKFKESSYPYVIVSPSLSTGWDFPYEECRFQIIGKIPFPNTQGEIMKGRVNRDKGYRDYLAMQMLVQACGRGMRAEDDFCECFVVDNNISWFLWKNKDLAPKWFLEAYSESGTIPPAREDNR